MELGVENLMLLIICIGKVGLEEHSVHFYPDLQLLMKALIIFLLCPVCVELVLFPFQELGLASKYFLVQHGLASSLVMEKVPVDFVNVEAAPCCKVESETPAIPGVPHSSRETRLIP